MRVRILEEALMPMYRVLVTGSRRYGVQPPRSEYPPGNTGLMEWRVACEQALRERAIVFQTLDGIASGHPIHIIQGGAEGADGVAREWAQSKCYPVTTFYANWTLHGKKAGPIRNREMVRESDPHLGVAFPGGAGTRNCIVCLEDAGVKVHHVVP